MRIIKKVIVLSFCLLTLSGCTQSKVTGEELLLEGPGATQGTEESIKVNRAPLVEETEPESMFNWEQVDESVIRMFDDDEYYPLGIEMSYESNEDTKDIKLVWILRNEATQEDAMEYATELVRMFNNILATQSTDVQTANIDDFGTLWDMFDLSVQIVKEDGSVMLDETYKAGSTIDLELPTYSEGGPTANPEAQVSPGDK